MRQYRGISKETGEWVYGYYLKYRKSLDGPHYIFPDIVGTQTKFLDQFVEVIPKTVGQKTGLKDKNGKEIYEGDVVIIGCYNLRAVIKYEHCSFRMFHASGSERRKYCGDGQSELIFHNCNISTEVIGNIHQNKELLE